MFDLKSCTMKKGLAVVMLLAFSLTIFAQTGVTRFMGIPIDGYKPEMIKKLEAKGFKLEKWGNEEYLTGEFNGMNVHLHVVTNNNEVWRIMLSDQNLQGETDIKIRFNRLCQQFLKNGRYISLMENPMIPDDENLSYEITVNDKRYEAVFSQLPDVKETEEVTKKITSQIVEGGVELSEDDLKKRMGNAIAKDMTSRLVWFMISHDFGKYRITMFYDNEKNKANGEDL